MQIFTSDYINSKIDRICLDTKVKKDFSWHYKFLISCIYLTPYTDRRYNIDDFVPVNFKILESLISKQEISNIVGNLITNNVIECDNEIVRKRKSKGYKIINRSECNWKLSEIKDSKLTLKIEKRRALVRKKISERGSGYRISDFWFREIDIDYKKAKKFIDNHFRKDTEQFDRGFLNIKMINDKLYFSSVDDKGNRLHTNLTVLPTPIRQFLTIDNRVLWQSDLANSQPVFLYTLLKKSNTIDLEELEKYKLIVSSGKFYEYMAEKADFRDLDLTNYEDRSKFKKTIFGGVLFDKNRKTLSRWEILFQAEFPSIFEFIREFKKNDYRSLAVALQKEESSFIFKTVEKIDKELNHPIITTIHDCIVSDESHIKEIKKIMEREFIILYSILPTIKIEIL